MVYLFNACLNTGDVHKDWRVFCIFSVHSGKGYRSECYGRERTYSLFLRIWGRFIIGWTEALRGGYYSCLVEAIKVSI